LSSFDEENLYELEKKLIENTPKFNGIKPRPIFIVDMDWSGLAYQDKIEVGRGFLEMNPSHSEVEALLKHELLHYVHPGQGHSMEFIEDAKEIGILDDIDRRQLFFDELNQTQLEGRVCYKTNQEGEQEFMIRDEPSWEGLEDVVGDANMPVGELLRMLREGYQMSRSEAAESIGISEKELKRVEKNKDLMILYLEEDFVKKIFWGIISASGRWKAT
jgi:DNA-binding XRE family transcriptional regulator